MREAADAERIRALARELGRAVPAGTRMYLTGGATAVLEGWRDSTIDIDVRLEPDSDSALQEIKVFGFDPYSQALSKLERGFELDLEDVRSMVRSGQVDPERLRDLFGDRGGAVSVSGGRPAEPAGRRRVPFGLSFSSSQPPPWQPPRCRGRG